MDGEGRDVVREYDEGRKMVCQGFYGNYHPSHEMTPMPLKYERSWECLVCSRVIVQPSREENPCVKSSSVRKVGWSLPY